MSLWRLLYQLGVVAHYGRLVQWSLLNYNYGGGEETGMHLFGIGEGIEDR